MMISFLTGARGWHVRSTWRGRGGGAWTSWPNGHHHRNFGKSVRIGRRLHRRFSEVSRHCPKLWFGLHFHDIVASDGSQRSDHVHRCPRQRGRSPTERETSEKCQAVAQSYHSSWNSCHLCTKPYHSCPCKCHSLHKSGSFRASLKTYFLPSLCRSAIQKNALKFPTISCGNTTSTCSPSITQPLPAVRNVCGLRPLRTTPLKWWTNSWTHWWKSGKQMTCLKCGPPATIPVDVKPIATRPNSKASSRSIMPCLSLLPLEPGKF